MIGLAEVVAAGGADDLPDALVVLDRSGCVVAVNRAAERLIGAPAGQLAGRPVGPALGARDSLGRVLLDRGWHASAALPSVRGVPEQAVRLRRADGRDMTAAATASYLRHPDGSLAGAVLCLRAPRRRAAEDPSGMEIVSTVSHELRSPLTSVKGYTSLLLNRWDRMKDEEKQMMLEQVNHDADRVTRLITELLDISRLETGRLVLRRQLLDLGRLAEVVVGKVRLQYPDLDATLRFPDAFPMAYADPDKVEQVLTNLVENACKYGAPRGLRIEGEVGEGEVAVSVVDRGEGIPPRDLAKIFAKFFRRSGGRPSGSGLGLWISRGLVEAHGGRLSATSLPGHGSTFRFTLPLVDLERLQET